MEHLLNKGSAYNIHYIHNFEIFSLSNYCPFSFIKLMYIDVA